MKKRILTSLIALPPLLWIVTQGNSAVTLGFFVLVQFLLALEIMRLYLQGFVDDGRSILGFARKDWGLAIISTSMFAFLMMETWVDSFSLLTVFLIGSLLLSALLPGTLEQRCWRAQSVLLALVYSIFPWVIICSLYLLAVDGRFIILLLSIAFAGDTAAYFFGKTWGRKKMAPIISPHKTWFGAVAGFMASMIAAGIVSKFYGGELGSWPFMMMVGGTAALAGQMGDLFKSVFKRHKGVKDSGSLIPGHGGLLDRLDSVVLSAPVLVLFF